MKNFLASVLLCASLALMIGGCAPANPNAGKPDANGQPQSAYLPNQTAKDTADTLGNIATVLPPPYGTIVGTLGVLIGGIASGIAYRKNGQAAQANATAGQLAASVVAQGPTVAQQVLDHASNNEAVYPAVANLVNQKTV